MISKSEIGNSIISVSEQIALIPKNLDSDLNEAVLYAYFAVQYYNEHLFRVICTKTDKFSSNFEFNQLLGKESSYSQLSIENSFSRFRLCQIAFQISLNKDYGDIADHFIMSGKVHITWEMI
jgi:hypothetical protein